MEKLIKNKSGNFVPIMLVNFACAFGNYSLFRLLYSSTSTVQRLEISRVQNLEISRLCTLEISRCCTVEVDE